MSATADLTGREDERMAGYDHSNGPEELVIRLIETAVKALDEMSEAAGEVAPDVGDLTDVLVSAQRVADRAALDLRRIADKVADRVAKAQGAA